MAHVISDPFNTNDLNPRVPVGTIGDGIDAYGFAAKFRYVQFKDSVAYLVGHLLTAADVTGTQVTNDRSGGSAVFSTQGVGVCCDVMTEDYYGWMQVTGKAVIQTDGAVAAGEALVAHTVDGEADTMAAGEEHLVIGVTFDADAADQGIAWLRNMNV